MTCQKKGELLRFGCLRENLELHLGHSGSLGLSKLRKIVEGVKGQTRLVSVNTERSLVFGQHGQ